MVVLGLETYGANKATYNEAKRVTYDEQMMLPHGVQE